MKSLLRSGALKIAGVFDSSKMENVLVALIALNVEKHQELDKKVEQIFNLDLVHWAAVVTGRYDIMVEVISPNGMADFYHFLTVKLPKVGGIHSSESFMIMKAKGKWILLPDGMKGW
jgi:Lrp/AsnC family transcriptional regulator for asnA, asnC and gidA